MSLLLATATIGLLHQVMSHSANEVIQSIWFMQDDTRSYPLLNLFEQPLKQTSHTPLTVH